MNEEKKIDCNRALEMARKKIEEIREKVDNMRNQEDAFCGRFGVRYYGNIEIKLIGEGLEKLIDRLQSEFPAEFSEIRKSEEFKSGLMKLAMDRNIYQICVNSDYLEKAINYHRPSVLQDPRINEYFQKKSRLRD